MGRALVISFACQVDIQGCVLVHSLSDSLLDQVNCGRGQGLLEIDPMHLSSPNLQQCCQITLTWLDVCSGPQGRAQLEQPYGIALHHLQWLQIHTWPAASA